MFQSTSTVNCHWKVFLEINLNQKTFNHTSWLHQKSSFRLTIKSMLSYGTSMIINIMLMYLWNIFLSHFMALVFFFPKYIRKTIVQPIMQSIKLFWRVDNLRKSILFHPMRGAKKKVSVHGLYQCISPPRHWNSDYMSTPKH